MTRSTPSWPRERAGEAVILWHGDRDLQGVDAVIVPGGFSYGDYLRAGAIARFAPVMEEVAEFARAGGIVLGICNGFQVLCEARLLPGALLPNASLRFVFRQVELEVVRTDTPFTRACERRQAAVDPGQAQTGRFYAPDDQLRRLESTARCCCATPPATTPTARCATSPGSATRRATCSA